MKRNVLYNNKIVGATPNHTRLWLELSVPTYIARLSKHINQVYYFPNDFLKFEKKYSMTLNEIKMYIDYLALVGFAEKKFLNGHEGYIFGANRKAILDTIEMWRITLKKNIVIENLVGSGVYGVFDDDNNCYYIGATLKTLVQRVDGHISTYINNYQYKKEMSMAFDYCIDKNKKIYFRILDTDASKEHEYCLKYNICLNQRNYYHKRIKK